MQQLLRCYLAAIVHDYEHRYGSISQGSVKGRLTLLALLSCEVNDCCHPLSLTAAALFVLQGRQQRLPRPQQRPPGTAVQRHVAAGQCFACVAYVR